jgi:hypothetical protein
MRRDRVQVEALDVVSVGHLVPTTSHFNIPPRSPLGPYTQPPPSCWQTPANLPQRVSVRRVRCLNTLQWGHEPLPAAGRAIPSCNPQPVTCQWHLQPRSTHQSSQNNSSSMSEVSSAHQHPLEEPVSDGAGLYEAGGFTNVELVSLGQVSIEIVCNRL